MMRLLLSAIIVSGFLGGDEGAVASGLSCSSANDDKADGGWIVCEPRREPFSRNGFGVCARFCGSACTLVPGPRDPRRLVWRCRFAPMDTERDLRAAAMRSRVGSPGWSSSGSRLIRSEEMFCEDDEGRIGAIIWETASPPLWRTRRWWRAALSKSVATRFRLGLGELMSGRNSAGVEPCSPLELCGGEGKARACVSWVFERGAAYTRSSYGFVVEVLVLVLVSDGDECGGVGGLAQEVELDSTPYIKNSEVAGPLFLIVLPLTLTNRPTGHCKDWWRSSSSSFTQIAPVNFRWSHCDVVGLRVCTSRLGPARAWRGMRAGFTKLRSSSLLSLDTSHCQCDVESTKRIPGRSADCIQRNRY